MNTSPKTSFLSEILAGQPIPLGKRAYFRERFRDRMYELVLSEFIKQEANGLTKAEVARRIGRRPEQVTRWLGAPGNWTIETVSDLLLAISKAEPKVVLHSLEGRRLRNYAGQDWHPNDISNDISWAVGASESFADRPNPTPPLGNPNATEPKEQQNHLFAVTDVLSPIS